MSPVQVLCAVTAFALLQLVIGVHHTTAHSFGNGTIASTTPRLDAAPLLEWLTDGLRAEQAAGALEDPEVAAARRAR